MRLTFLLEFLLNVIGLIENRVSDDFRKLATAWGAVTIEEAVNAYYAAFRELRGDPADMVKLFVSRSAPLEQVRHMLLLHFYEVRPELVSVAPSTSV